MGNQNEEMNKWNLSAHCGSLLKMKLLVKLILGAVSLVTGKKPHVLIIVSDDAGFADVSWTGGVIPTPVLDEIRQESVTFNNFYVHPVCTPTRASLLTGRYAAVSGLNGPLFHGSTCSIDSQLPSFGKEMKARHYKTIMSGKWHLGFSQKEHTPESHGFDEFYGPLGCCCSYYNKTFWQPEFVPGVDFYHNGKPLVPPPRNHASEDFATHMAAKIREHGAEGKAASIPLFMMLTLTAPHSPLQPSADHLERCKHVHTHRRRLFCGLMVSVDEAVRSVRVALEDANMWKDTIVVYFNDNGANIWEGGRNYPFRGGKQSAWEGGSRAAAFIRLPTYMTGVTPSSKVFDGLAHVSDVMPTVLSLVDASLQNNTHTTSASRGQAEGDSILDEQQPKVVGYDLSSVLLDTSAPAPRSDVLLTFDPYRNDEVGRASYRWGKWKVFLGDPGDARFVYEPTGEHFIGTDPHDWAIELMMYFWHWLDEDKSGSLDEGSRDIGLALKESWRALWDMVTSGKSKHASTMYEDVMLFNLDLDPFEHDDVKAAHPLVLKRMLSRVKYLATQFPHNKTCNWWMLDKTSKPLTFSIEKNMHESKHAKNDQHEMLAYAPWITDAKTHQPKFVDARTHFRYILVSLMFLEVVIANLVLWGIYRFFCCVCWRCRNSIKSKTD